MQLSVAKVDPIPVPARTHLTAAVEAGRDVMLHLDFGALYGQRAKAATQFLFRRWVLNILIALRVRGPMSYNEIKNMLGGLAGGSLSPKMKALQAHGLVEQVPGDVVKYRLCRDAEIVGSAAYTLTLGKAERYHQLFDADFPVEMPNFSDPPEAPQSEQEYRDAVARFAQFAQDFSKLHDSAMREQPEATALRFTQACVHYWHGPVLIVAEFSGGATFSQLKDALGISDAALTKALQGLSEVGSLVRDSKDLKYRITSGGRFDLALGFGVPAVLAQVWEKQGRFQDGLAKPDPTP